MIQYLVAGRGCGKTGRALARKISQKQGQLCKFTRNQRDPSVSHVAWGTRSSDKLAELKKMAEAGIATPKIFSVEEAVSNTNSYRIFRKRHHVAANDDPYIVQRGIEADRERASCYNYALEFIQAESEFRVHVFNGEAIRTQKKFHKRGESPDPSIKCSTRRWVLCDAPHPSNGETMRKLAIKAINTVGLKFGAVDILRKNDGGLVVLEVNSAPGLNESGLELYAEAFINQGE